MRYVGIDPGKQGGIAVLSETGVVLNLVKMPETIEELWRLFEALKLYATIGPMVAALERVHSSPQMGVVSAFTFGQGFGALAMACCASEIPTVLVTPQKWQKAMGCLTGGDKNVSKARAKELFPLEKIVHATADALLLAEFCRRSHQK